jgi:hypothetical protein
MIDTTSYRYREKLSLVCERRRLRAVFASVDEDVRRRRRQCASGVFDLDDVDAGRKRETATCETLV